MHLVEFLRADLVLAELRAADKDGVLRELAALVGERERLDAVRIYHVWAERERLASTGIGEGVAIPHGKLPGLERVVAALGRSRAGIDFDSLDGSPAHLFFALVAPETSAGMHLKALARISRLLKDVEFRGRLLAAPDAERMYRVLVEEDAKY